METSCYDLSRFGLENWRKISQIFNNDIYLLFYLLIILWASLIAAINRWWVINLPLPCSKNSGYLKGFLNSIACGLNFNILGNVLCPNFLDIVFAKTSPKRSFCHYWPVCPQDKYWNTASFTTRQRNVNTQHQCLDLTDLFFLFTTPLHHQCIGSLINGRDMFAENCLFVRKLPIIFTFMLGAFQTMIFIYS